MFREMRRFKQQLPEEQCVQILKEAPRGVLALLGDEDYPYTVPLDHFYEDGKLYFHCAKEGHKLDAIKNSDKCSYCVLANCTPDGDTSDGQFYFFDSVVVFGRIRRVEDEEVIIRQVRKLAHKYYTDLDAVERDIKKNGPRTALLELTIEHMTGKHVHEK